MTSWSPNAAVRPTWPPTLGGFAPCTGLWLMGNGVLSYRDSNIDGAASRCRMVMPLKARRTESLPQPQVMTCAHVTRGISGIQGEPSL